MARTQIDIPEKVIFKTELPVRVSDINYGGHVGNDSILGLMQEARVLFYRSIGVNSEVSIAGNVGQIITDASVVYKSESFLGDILVVHLSVADFNKYGFEMYYQLFNKQTGKEVARGRTGILCFDYEKRKVASVPPAFFERLNPIAE
jgi:acyl-CoA thioester hydrolase